MRKRIIIVSVIAVMTAFILALIWHDSFKTADNELVETVNINEKSYDPGEAVDDGAEFLTDEYAVSDSNRSQRSEIADSILERGKDDTTGLQEDTAVSSEEESDDPDKQPASEEYTRSSGEWLDYFESIGIPRESWEENGFQTEWFSDEDFWDEMNEVVYAIDEPEEASGATEAKGAEISSITSPGTGKIKVQWNSQENEMAGYLLQYSTDRGFASKSTNEIEVADSRISKKTIRELKSGTTYYVRIRSFKQIENIKYYTDWSEIQSVTVK